MIRFFWKAVSFWGTLAGGLVVCIAAMTQDLSFGLAMLADFVVITIIANTYKAFRFKPRPDNPEGYRPPRPIQGLKYYQLLNPVTAIAFFKYVDSGSMPSIHSARSFNLALLIALKLGNPLIGAAVLAFAALIAWSRVVLLRHDKYDISVGGTLGLIIAAATMALL